MNKQDGLLNDKDYKFTPHGTQVIVAPRQMNKTKSGIIIPDGVELEDPLVDVISVGEEVKHYKAGDVVIGNPRVSIPLPGKTHKYFILEEGAVICLAEEIRD